MERKKHISRIIELLGFLKNNVELSVSQNLNDIAVASENFYRDFLNLVLGYQLENENFSDKNAAAIDLGDKTKKIAFQVTATSALVKTRKTVKSFVNHKLHNVYDRLIILVITDKTNHNVKAVDEDGFSLNTSSDIWGINEVMNEINNLQTDHLKQVVEFLENEIKIDKNPTLAKEIRTFTELMFRLSDDSHNAAGKGFVENPDPEKKIYKRFADESAFLTKEYQDLYIEYGVILQEVAQLSDIGTSRIRRLGLHLRTHSDQVLTDCSGNAKEALSKLVTEYTEVLSKSGGEYDVSAIRFFLVQQLIQCNVFPNKEVMS